MEGGRTIVALVLLGPWLVCHAQPAQHTNFLDLSGSLDWEFLSKDGESQNTQSSTDSLRQRYSVDLAGSIWDARFARFLVGLDLFVTAQNADQATSDSKSIGYRASTTLFPGRGFPLRLFARRLDTSVEGIALADSDRDTSAWGVEWNLSTLEHHSLRLLFDHSTLDLTSPVALAEQRDNATVEYGMRFRRRDTTLRFNSQTQQERVNGSDFDRRTLTWIDRTRFDGGATLFVNTHRTETDSLFSSGATDEVDTTRASAVLDLPRKERLGVTISYDFNDNQGRFLDSTGHNLRTRFRVAFGERWSADAGATAGRIDSTTGAGEIEQDLAGLFAGARYNRPVGRARVGLGYSLGYNESKFNTGPDRRQVSHSADVNTTVPLSGRSEFFGTISQRKDDNDTTGLGFTFDETRVDAGVESRSESLRFRGAAFYIDSVHDTFQFGTQESDEIGLEGSLDHDSGGMSIRLSSRDGISDFVPAGGGPFVPDNDLESEADVGTVGIHWRFPHRLLFRLQARLENRRFTTIGKERIVSFHPRLDWTFRVWRFTAGNSFYRRDNETMFQDDTWILRATRVF